MPEDTALYSGKRVDLHTHSTASDGTVPPSQLVEHAANMGLCAIALTDHDTIAGVEEAQKTAEQYAIDIIPGCEIAVQFPGGELHILGLYVPVKNETFLSMLSHEQKKRKIRNEKIMERLKAMGVKLDQVELATCTASKAAGRPHIARALVASGYALDVKDAFRKFLGYKAAAYVPRELLSPEEGVSRLAECGATVLIAHPCLSSYMNRERLDALITRLKPCGLAGIEVLHSSHGPDDVTLCREMVAKHDIVSGGGSDFHGPSKPHAQLGFAEGNTPIPHSFLEQIKKDRIKKGLPLY